LAPFRRPGLAALLLVLLAGCALPPNTALRDWARTASVTADRPGLMPPEDALLAQQEALAAYLYALSVLARPEQRLTFDDAAFGRIRARAAPVARAEAAIGGLAAVLAGARDANLAPGARANSAHPARVVEDLRLPPFVAAADPPLQALLAALGEGLGAAGGADADRAAYRRLLAAIAEDHAMIAAQARHIEAREVARRIQAAEDRLLRLALLLPPDPSVARRSGAAGAVARVVQP
jgi:hypothetical protein